MTVAPLIAPIMGGQILKFAGWEGLFLFLSILGCLAFVLASTRLSESLGDQKTVRMLSAQALVQPIVRYSSHRQAMRYILAHGFFFGGMFAFISGSPFVYIELFGIRQTSTDYLFA